MDGNRQIQVHLENEWLRGLVGMALDSRLNGCEFDSRPPPRLILGWVTVFGRAYHLSISPSHPSQLSLLPYAGREMSTGESAVMLCGWDVKDRMAHSIMDKGVGGIV